MTRPWLPWCVLFAVAGCVPLQPLPDEPPTRQVASTPFTESRRPTALTKVNCPPASPEIAIRVELTKGQLIGKNPQLGLRPQVTALGSTEMEIFHVGLDQVYITEGLVKQCSTDGNLAAALAYEFGRMVSRREAVVSDDVRQPERLKPIALRIGSNGYADDADPTYLTQLGLFEKQSPKKQRKLARPNPENVARSLLEQAGFQRTELDAVLPLLQQAERFSILENQFKGNLQQGDWQRP